MSTTRLLPRLFAALGVGVFVTIALSWTAMVLPWGAQKWYGPPAVEELGVAHAPGIAKTFEINRGHNAWHTVVTYWWMQISGQSITLTNSNFNARRFDPATLPAHMRPASLDDLNMMSWYHEVGWPLPSMTCSVHWQQQILNANVMYQVEGGMQLPRDAQFNPRALPLTPLWQGFILDLMLWAALWLTLTWSIGATRQAWRRRHMRCTHCGYSRTGLLPGAACPECGGAAESRQPKSCPGNTRARSTPGE